MNKTFGIRREDKNKWERRVPLIPKQVKELKEKNNLDIFVQPSPIRIYSNEEYRIIGANVQEDLSSCPIVFAVKEIPINFFKPGGVYIFFSHTIKGQKYNMPMLQKMIDLGCTLIDYEKIVDKMGRRLVFFGKFAGLAGMVDTLWAFGQRLKFEGEETLFSEIKKTISYRDLDDIKTQIKEIGKKIEKNGFSKAVSPVVVGFAGYGNVSLGAQEILDLLPVKVVSPKDIKNIFDSPSNKCIYKVVFKEEDMVKPISSENCFELQDYYKNPEKYEGFFEEFIPCLSILMNCIYWDERYPRLITKEFFKKQSVDNIRLKVIGDISVDINGAIEFTEKSTDPDNPVFLYDQKNDSVIDGFEGNGIVVMAVDNLPCELPKESSKAFGESLLSFIPNIVKADFNVNFEDLELPFEIKNAVILHRGKLTLDYEYINKYL